MGMDAWVWAIGETPAVAKVTATARAWCPGLLVRLVWSRRGGRGDLGRLASSRGSSTLSGTLHRGWGHSVPDRGCLCVGGRKSCLPVRRVSLSMTSLDIGHHPGWPDRQACAAGLVPPSEDCWQHVPSPEQGCSKEGDEGRDMFVIFAVVSTGWFPPG